MSITINIPKPKETMKDLGLLPGGDTHKFIVNRIAEYLVDYVPRREYDSFVDALKDGTEPENSRIVIDLIYADKLYRGENISSSREDGTYSRGTINYTKRPNPKAGPFFDKRMMADKSEVLYREINNYIRSR